MYGCECNPSTVPSSAPSPLNTDQFKCIADPPHCINLQNATIAKLLPCTLKDLCPTTAENTTLPENTTSTETSSNINVHLYIWPVLSAVGVTALVVGVVIALSCWYMRNKRRSVLLPYSIVVGLQLYLHLLHVKHVDFHQKHKRLRVNLLCFPHQSCSLAVSTDTV